MSKLIFSKEQMTIMNKKILIFSMVVITLAFTSCNKTSHKPMSYEEAKEEFIDEPVMDLSSQDTVEVKKLIDNYLGTLRTYDFAGAVSLLKYQVGDSVVDLPAEERAKQIKMLSMFKGIKYDLKYMSFMKNSDCAALYEATLFEKTDPKDTRPNTIAFMLKPVRWNNKWYLTLADSENKNVAPSKISMLKGAN